MPFNASLSLDTKVNAPNSLKHKNRLLWMQHQDGIKGWNKWEDMFEKTLYTHFDIRPDSSTSSHARPTITQKSSTQSNSIPEFSRAALQSFVNLHSLKVDDFTPKNGQLWVRTDNANLQVNRVLIAWRFTFKAGKGWWR